MKRPEQDTNVAHLYALDRAGGEDSDCARAENAGAALVDAKISTDLQRDVMKILVFLSCLNPDRAPNSRSPSPACLIWGLVNVAATAQQRLRLLDEPKDVRRADLATVVADVHA